MEQNEERQSDIELHPEIAKQRQDTYSSLTDLSGIAVFSDEFEILSDKVEQKKVNEDKALQDKVFFSEILSTAGKDDDLLAKVFVEKQEQPLLQDYRKEQYQFSFIEIGLILISVLVMTAVYLFLFQKKTPEKRKRGGTKK